MLTMIAITAVFMAGRSAARGFEALWLRVVAWRIRRVNRAILYALDDHSLHDIGIHRSGIEAAVRDIDAGLARRRRLARTMQEV